MLGIARDSRAAWPKPVLGVGGATCHDAPLLGVDQWAVGGVGCPVLPGGAAK